MMVVLALVLLAGLWTTNAKAQVLYNESFATAVPLPTGWAQQNLSTPIGTAPTWVQGVAAVFPANSGGPTEYIRAYFQNVAGANIISNWLFAPSTTVKNGDILTFYTRTINPAAYADRLQVRLSTNGASVNVGATNTSVGDFSTLLLDVNPTYSLADYPAGYPQSWHQYSITVSGLAGPTTGRVAFRYFVEDGGPLGNNSDNIGIDDVVYTTFPAACSGTPSPGATSALPASVCPTTNITLSLPGFTASAGITYQWQSGTSATGPWVDIPGATGATAVTQQAAATYYRANVTCSGNTGASTPVLVSMNPPNLCYCEAGSTDIDPTFEKISNVTMGTLNNSSTSPLGYEDFTTLPTAPAFIVGSNPLLTVTGSNTYGGDRVRVWIDFNQNGSFTDPGEAVFVSVIGAGPYAGNIAIPATATLGNTRMRIRLYDAQFGNGVNTPCGDNTYGQVEDYTINIAPCVQGAVTSDPANASVACGSSASFTVGASGSFPTYLWEYRTSASGPWLNVPNVAPYTGVTAATLNIGAVDPSMSGYQYRAIVGGTCTALISSGFGTLTVTPLTVSVSPAAPVICNGSTQQLSIGTTTPFSSGTINLAVPDNTANGVSNTINVSGIPGGATITDIQVTLNMSHTYPGDMIFNLKAPNGQILNLYKYAGGTFTGPASGVPTWGWYGARISSNGTTPFSSVTTAPFIYGSAPLWKADLLNAAVPGPTVQAPTGYVPTATTWGQLYTTGGSTNGAWTLAMADGGPGDLGTLASWSIAISYGAPSPGAWGPVTVPPTIWLDAAHTIPYTTGTLANVVYVNPTTSTTYNVVVNTAACAGSPTNIPVEVDNPISGVATIANDTTCVGSTASFTATAAAGNTITYTWDESVDGGITWTPVVDGGVYSGATTGTLTLTGVPITMNAYQYRAHLAVAACGSTATSNAATLKVNANPNVSIAAAPYTKLYPGLTTTLTATVSPAAATYQWYHDGIAIPGATGSTTSVDVDGLGDYYVTINDVNGCNGQSNTINISDSANDIMFIYPNPNTGKFQIRYYSLPGNTLVRSVSIFDSKGARVYSKNYGINVPYGKIEVDMSQQPRGVYMVELGDLNGARLKTGRVIIF